MANWKKSSFCGNSSCLEVMLFPKSGYVSIRNLSRGGYTVACSTEEWDAFIAGVKNGEFDAVDL